MSRCRAWHLLVAGCGTVGYALARGLRLAPVVGKMLSVTFVDFDVIELKNAHTCPGYASFAGRYKAEILSELTSAWLPDGMLLRALCRPVQHLDWVEILSQTVGAAGRAALVVVAGLERWPARLSVVREVRRAAAGTDVDVLVVQTGLDRGEAVVSTFEGRRLESPCPVCGIVGVMPAPEACVLRTADGKLLRGNLRTEARAAARLVTDGILPDFLGPRRSRSTWVDTKTEIKTDGAEPRRRTMARRRMPGCQGAHMLFGPAGAKAVFGS